jgi:predicted dehydrogenase
MRKLNMGMVGGGIDSFIGAVHRMAAVMDGHIEVVCGALSSTPERSQKSGELLGLPDSRIYESYHEMIENEKELPIDERMDFVCIVTPNNLHFEPAKLALKNGFHVMSDKPMTHNLKEAVELVRLVEKTGLVFGLTHNYTGYPMVKQARAMVRNGELGKIRKIAVEYFQGWLATKLEDTDHKQAGWRTDPKQSGAANCMGDIGTHAENLAEYITGLKIESLCADLTSFVPGRTLEDDGNVLLRFNQGARGTLLATQVAIGEENGLKIRIYGEKGGLEWAQQEPNSLKLNWLNKPFEVMRTGTNFDRFASPAISASRLPSGHPEGFIEAFANLYKNFALTVKARIAGKEPDPEHLDFPSVYDGARGMAFIETVVESSKSQDKWVTFKEYI